MNERKVREPVVQATQLRQCCWAWRGRERFKVKTSFSVKSSRGARDMQVEPYSWQSELGRHGSRSGPQVRVGSSKCTVKAGMRVGWCGESGWSPGALPTQSVGGRERMLSREWRASERASCRAKKRNGPRCRRKERLRRESRQ